MCGQRRSHHSLRRHLAVVHRDGKTLVLDAHSRDLVQALGQFRGGVLEDGHERGGRRRCCDSVPSGPINSNPWLPAYQMPGMPTRLRTSARSRPLRMATGHTFGDEFSSASAAPSTSLAASGSETMGDSVPSIVQEQHRLACAGDADQLTVGRPAHSAVREIRLSPVRTATSARSATTTSAPWRGSSSACPLRSMPMTSANPPPRPASTPASASSTTTERCGRAPSRRVASRSTAGSGLPGSPRSCGDHPVDADAEQVADPGVLQDSLAVAA